MTIDEAKQLQSGTHIYHATKLDSRGHSVRYKVTSIKTWKRDPMRIEVGLKYGMYAYEKIEAGDLHNVTKEATK
jgi:hypothetical protein